jgi:hypothetical protein
VGDSDCPEARIRRPLGMGAKYLPSIKDQKLNQRFQQKVNPLKKFNKAGGRPAKKSGKR